MATVPRENLELKVERITRSAEEVNGSASELVGLIMVSVDGNTAAMLRLVADLIESNDVARVAAAEARAIIGRSREQYVEKAESF